MTPHESACPTKPTHVPKPFAATMFPSPFPPPMPVYPNDGCAHSTAGRHHKAADTLADRNVIIRLFYGCYPFFAFCCVGTELFYVALYLLVFIPDASFALGGGGLAISLHAVSLVYAWWGWIFMLLLPLLSHL